MSELAKQATAGTRPVSRAGWRIGVVLATTCLAPLVAYAQECIDYGETFRWVNMLQFSNFLYSVGVHSGYAYVGRPDGIEIVDVSDPLAMRSVGFVDGQKSAYRRDIEISGAYAYVAIAGRSDAFSGVRILSLANPAAPRVVSEIAAGGSVYDIVLQDGFAYVAAGESGLEIADISEPLSPRIVGTADTPGDAWGVALSGGLACVADANSGVHFFDVSDPSTPDLVRSVTTPGRATGVAFSEGYALVADGSGGIHVVEVTNPTAAEIVFTDESVYARRVAVVGSRVYALEHGHVALLDASSLPTLERIASGPGSTYGATSFAIAGANVYYTLDRGFLHVLDASVPKPAPLVGELEMSGRIVDVSVWHEYALLADHTTQIQIVDMSDPSSPRPAGVIDVGGSARSAVVAADHAYVRYDFAIDVIDLSNAPEAHVIGTVGLPATSSSRELAVSGEHVYAPAHGAGVAVIDVSDPVSPRIVHTVDSQEARAIAVDGAQGALITWSDTFSWLDMASPGQPEVLGTIALPDQPNCVTVVGSVAYVGIRFGLLVVDGSDPNTPSIVGSVTLPYSPTEVVVHDGLAYASAWQAGVLVVDIKTPSALRVLGHFDALDAQAVAVAGDHIVVADRFGGLRIGPTQCGIETAMFLEEFTAHVTSNAVTLHWRVASCEAAGQFSLQARCGARQWNVEFEALGHGSFGATDRSPDLTRGEPVTYRLSYRKDDSPWVVVGERQVVDFVAPSLRLLPAAPNPFNPHTTLSFNLATASHVTLTIHRLNGRPVIKLLDGPGVSGRNAVVWHGTDRLGRRVASGVYMARLQAGGSVFSQKLVLLK